MGELTRGDLVFMTAVIMFSAFFAAYVTLSLGKVLVKKVQRERYQPLSFVVITFLVLFVYALTGLIGLLILITATAIGLIAPLSGIKRTHSMAVLVISTVFYYLNLF